MDVKIDFNEIMDRSNTSSVKWDPAMLKKLLGREAQDTLPLWVADMDFRCAPAIIDRLQKRVENGIFGYAFPDERYFVALQFWNARRHGWQIDPAWVTITPGIVPALSFIIHALTEPNDKVIIQQPVYTPFFTTIQNTDRVPSVNLLIEDRGYYTIDFEDFERKASDPAAKLFILCSPHNPVGRVWNEDELRQLGDICQRHNVTVVADEIHNDLIMPGYRHIPYASLGDAFASHAVVCTAPSKTFNLAGLQNANLIIPNPELKAKIDREFQRYNIHGTNLMGLEATIAAYSEGGEQWLDEALAYLDENAAFIESYTAEHMPKVGYRKPEGTYLAWLDFRAYVKDHEPLAKLMKEQANVLLNEGFSYGPSGEGFMRLNFACPRSILEAALNRIHQALLAYEAPEER